MSLKALQERRFWRELNDAKQEIERLRNELEDTKLHQFTNATGDNNEELNEELRLQLQAAEITLTNTIFKNERIEKELDKERQEHQHQLEKLKSENSHLKTTNERLHRQLQVEKAENTGRLGWIQRENCDRDDEEGTHLMAETAPTLPARHTRKPPALMRSETQYESVTPTVTSTFRLPTSGGKISELDFISTEKTPTSVADSRINQKSTPCKKRKRAMEEEVEDELPELRLGGFEPPTRPRTKSGRAPASVTSDEQS